MWVTVPAEGTSLMRKLYRGRADIVECLRTVTRGRRGRHLLVTLAALITPQLEWVYAGDSLRTGNVAVVEALLAGAGGATAAMLAALAARLQGDVRLGWIGAALACYSLVAIPATSAELVHAGVPTPVAALPLLAHLTAVVLLVCAVAGATPPRGWTAVVVALGAGGLYAGVAALAVSRPAEVAAVVTATPLPAALAGAWLLTVAALSLHAVQRRSWALWYLVVGLGLLGTAHAARVAHRFLPAAPETTLPLVRFAAIAVVLLATARLGHDALVRLSVDLDQREEELRIAQARLHRAAERDHELRSGLAGLAGATGLLRGDRPVADTTALGSALASELTRLDDLLKRGSAAVREEPRRPAGRYYRVAPVLSGLAALRVSAGMDLTVQADPALRATGSSTVLAQVVTNLLDNAARHAPGSPVRVTVHEAGDQIAIRVRDFGPGIPPGWESAVFERGIHDKRAGGSGLGLSICRRLVAGQCGTIAVGPSTPDRPGCTIVVRIPAAQTPAQVPADATVGAS